MSSPIAHSLSASPLSVVLSPSHNGVKARSLLSTVKTEGGLLPAALLLEIAKGSKDLDITSASYHLQGDSITETVADAYARARAKYLRSKRNDGTFDAVGFIEFLFSRCLDYGNHFSALSAQRDRAPLFIFDGVSYQPSHIINAPQLNHVVFHWIDSKADDLDKRHKDVAGADKKSPHALVQELLNRSEVHQWGFLSNGLVLRILRDNLTMTRQAYVEFDLAAMFEDDVYADFDLLWRLCHVTRLQTAHHAQNTDSTAPSEKSPCILEQWTQRAAKEGVRSLEKLREGVQRAIEHLGSSFLVNNPALYQKLQKGQLSFSSFTRQLLRLAYRLIFLCVAEDRELLFVDGKTPEASMYRHYYSLRRLRDMSSRVRGNERHHDLWSMFVLVMRGLHEGEPSLGLPALGSSLWSPAGLPDLLPYLSETDNSAILVDNFRFLEAIRSLCFFIDENKANHANASAAKGTGKGSKGSKTSKAAGKRKTTVRRPVDFRNLGAEELGSVYESLLELIPNADDPKNFTLQNAAGNERKTTGSYYTPESLIQELLSSALDPVLETVHTEKDLFEVTVCDPACGSGHFLVAAAHRLAQRLAQMRSGGDVAGPSIIQKALREVIARCIYGVDRNEMAVELCKVSLWLESMEAGKPLAFLDAHIRCGDALLGATPALLKRGLPDEVFAALTGDDKKVCSEAKKRNKAEKQGQQSLLTSAPEAWSSLPQLSQWQYEFETSPDGTIADIHAKEQRFADDHAMRKRLRLWADVYCASYFWPKTLERSQRGLSPLTHDTLQLAERNPAALPRVIQDEVKRLAQAHKFFHWHVEFPHLFTPKKWETIADDEPTGWTGGFRVMLGNPPWEKIKLQEQEWFAVRKPSVVAAKTASTRKKMIEDLATAEPHLYAEWQAAQYGSEAESNFIRNSKRFPLCGRGDVNTYAVFAEHMRNVVHENGRAGFIVPTGIATDDTTKHFFGDLVSTQSLASLYDFENQGIFVGVHNSYKFCLMTLARNSKNTQFIFFAHATTDLQKTEKVFLLSANDIELINPNTKTCPTFRSQRDAEITKAVYRKVPVLILGEDEQAKSPWQIRFSRMFDMSNDSHLFHEKQKLLDGGFSLDKNIFRQDDKTFLPLYEAKMAHHYDHRFGDYTDRPADSENTSLPTVPISRLIDPHYSVQSRYWVDAVEVDAVLQNKWKRDWLLGWRDICRATDSRTVIAAVIPKVAVGNKIPLIFSDDKKIFCLQAVLSSFVLDYSARQKIGGTSLNYYIIKQLPVLPPETFDAPCAWSTSETYSDWIKPRVLELTYTAWDLQPFAKDLGYDGDPFIWDDDKRFQLRCELDAAMFILYGIERHDVDYIMETFPIVKRDDEEKYQNYRTKIEILRIYDEMKRKMQR